MGRANRRGVLLDVLAAGPGRPIDVHLDVFLRDVDLDLVRLGQDGDGGGGGVDSPLGLGLRDPLYPVDARLVLEPGVSSSAAYLEDNLLQSAEAGIAR